MVILDINKKEDNDFEMKYWNGCIIGPVGTTYDFRTYNLDITIDDKYP